jgi:alkylation response protein AidB-like acyl-CoA dehydrogenase
MNVAFTEEQNALRDEAKSFLAANPEPSWQQLAELGWTGVSIEEADGGAGLGFLEEAVLAEELGRALYHGPWLTTIALIPALPRDELGKVARGETSWTLALGELVPDLDTADRFAIVGGDGVWELEGAERELLSTMDSTRPLGRVRGGEPGSRLGDSDALPAVRARMLTGLALEACGVAAAALALGVEHARMRTQFGRPIGVYQAVSHPLADTYREVELARSLAIWAAWCVAEDDGNPPTASAAAKAQAAEAAVVACERSIQIHAGIGFTWEHVLHRLYKRAQGIQTLEASPAQLRAEVATAILDGQGA